MTHHSHSRYPHQTARRRIQGRSLMAVAAAMLLGAIAAQACAWAARPASSPSPPAASPAPPASAPVTDGIPGLVPFQAVVLVSSGGADETVNILLPTEMDYSQVMRIVARMGELGGWTPVGVRVEEERFRSAWDKSKSGKDRAPVQTYVEFSASGVINHREGWINLEPFIIPLRDRTPMRVALAVTDNVGMVGPGNSESNAVKVICNRVPRSIVYDITIKDPDLTSTGLLAHAPKLQPAAPRAAEPKQERRSPLTGVIIGLAVLAAAGAGLACLRWKGLGPWAAKDRPGSERSADSPGAEAPQVGTEKEGESGS